jgi:hypothetical protein
MPADNIPKGSYKAPRGKQSDRWSPDGKIKARKPAELERRAKKGIPCSTPPALPPRMRWRSTATSAGGWPGSVSTTTPVGPRPGRRRDHEQADLLGRQRQSAQPASEPKALRGRLALTRARQ